jgi:hypothetical protein
VEAASNSTDEFRQAREGWKTVGVSSISISDLLERSEEVPLDVIVVHEADQVVALLNLL